MSDDESVEMTELHWKIPDEEYNSFLEADGSLTHANRARLWNKYHSKALFCSSAEDGSLKNYTKGHAINRHRPKKRIYILYEMEDMPPNTSAVVFASLATSDVSSSLPP